MATKKPPKFDTWMPLYIGDYIVATTHLSTEQHGAYLLLLMTAWKSGGRLPNDHQQLQQITRLSPQSWAKHEPVLRQFFVVTPEHWSHERVIEELETAKAMVEKSSAAGKVAAAKRWGLRVV
jgi:uncharacterized protein YdaU (DUF1376 family)